MGKVFPNTDRPRPANNVFFFSSVAYFVQYFLLTTPHKGFFSENLQLTLTLPTYLPTTFDAECGNRTRATLVEGKCSHHNGNPAT